MKALVLAAGKSTRIAAQVASLPKPLIAIAGLPILERSLRWLTRHGITEIFINLHYEPQQIRAAIGDGARLGARVSYVHEPQILGTAGAVKNLEAQWSEDFLVVYGDNLLGFDLADFLRRHREGGALATVAVFNRHTDAYSGIIGGTVALDDAHRITAFREGAGSGQAPSAPWVNAGVYALQPALCRHIPPGQFADFGRDVFPALLAQGIPLQGYPIHSYCLAVDTPAALATATRLFAQVADDAPAA
jgi:mannose-1-phosphate guanylyltransferase